MVRTTSRSSPTRAGTETAPYFQALQKPVRISRTIRDREMAFFVEPPTLGFSYACTIEDVVRLLAAVPAGDLAGIAAIVFRQPTRKQELLNPVWGRLVFDVRAHGVSGSAIHLDAQDPRVEGRYSLSLDPGQQELQRLAADGHHVVRCRRWWAIRSTVDSIRTTQLYHTLLHEIGHAVDWRRWPAPDRYFRRPLDELERYAWRYATSRREALERKGAIPFDRIRDQAAMRADGLDPQWFGLAD